MNSNSIEKATKSNPSKIAHNMQAHLVRPKKCFGCLNILDVTTAIINMLITITPWSFFATSKIKKTVIARF